MIAISTRWAIGAVVVVVVVVVTTRFTLLIGRTTARLDLLALGHWTVHVGAVWFLATIVFDGMRGVVALVSVI